MPWFQNMSAAEKFRVVTMPYRVGYWMSQVDDVEGDQDDKAELEALERILKIIAKVHDQSSFVKACVKECLRQRKKWDEWSPHNPNTLRDVHNVMREVLDRRHAEDMKIYRVMLYKIAEAVAAAYNENAANTEEESESFWEGLGGFFKSGGAMDQKYMNISETEAQALKKLKAVMIRSVQPPKKEA